MRNLTPEFRRALYEDNRNYLAYADITLSDNTQLHLTNSELWTGGFSWEEAVSEDNSFTAVGAVIIGSANIIINNIYDDYSEYDFTNAKVVLWLGMQFDTLEKFKIGTYIVDSTNYNGATIQLSLLDNMSKFDRPYSESGLVYPATLSDIVIDCCTQCGVIYGGSLPTLTVDEIRTRPADESITFREVLSWCATLCSCFAKCDANGDLTFGWFDMDALDESASTLDGGTFNPWSSGTQHDGGTFNPWSSGSLDDGGSLSRSTNVHYLYALYSQNISMDDVVITGVSTSVKDEDEDATQDFISVSTGTTGYVIEIEQNGFITKTNAQTIINDIGSVIIGMRFRPLNVSQASDPAIQAGDVAIVVDRKNTVYRALVTRMSFSVDSDQTIVCGASTPLRNSATRFSSITKSYVESRKLLKDQQTTYDRALDNLADALAQKSGMYSTIESTQSGDIYYLHDKPLLSQSKVVWKMTTEALGVTTDYKGDNPSTTVWNFGVLATGDTIVRILNAEGINASWINAGTVSANYIRGGTLNLGGAQNGNGVLQIVDSSNRNIGKWDKDGIVINGGSFICYETYS